MKTLQSTILLMVLFLFSGCAQKGFVKSGQMIVLDDNDNLLVQAEKSNAGQYNLTYKKLDKNEYPLLDDIPVGAIIPYFGPWDFSDRWQFCIGQEIRDPDSPLYGRTVPDLMGGKTFEKVTYVAGTLDQKTLNTYIGDNKIPPQSNHGHPASTGGATGSVRPDKNSSGDYTKAASPNHTHSVSVSGKGEHNHGGSNIPHSYTLVYLIRVK